jgi:biopolymer transport protein ExbB/TolQ
MMTYIYTAFSRGEIWMYAILFFQILSLAIIAERVYFLYFRRAGGQRKISQVFETDIKTGNLESALKRAESIGTSEPIGTVVAAGIQAALHMGGREEIQAKMEELVAVETEKLDQRTGFLAMLGNVGTLLGLLGTVIGMIKAFSSIASVNPAEKSALLTEGVALAMNTTAYGLIMAIPALVMFAVLNNRSQKLQEDLNQGATKVYNWLSFNFEPVQKTKKRSV